MWQEKSDKVLREKIESLDPSFIEDFNKNAHWAKLDLMLEQDKPITKLIWWKYVAAAILISAGLWITLNNNRNDKVDSMAVTGFNLTLVPAQTRIVKKESENQNPGGARKLFVKSLKTIPNDKYDKNALASIQSSIEIKPLTINDSVSKPNNLAINEIIPADNFKQQGKRKFKVVHLNEQQTSPEQISSASTGHDIKFRFLKTSKPVFQQSQGANPSDNIFSTKKSVFTTELN